MYFTRAINTSTVGILKDGSGFEDSMIFVGIVHSEETEVEFVGRPWEASHRKNIELRPLKAYRYAYAWTKKNVAALKHCVVYDEPRVVKSIGMTV